MSTDVVELIPRQLEPVPVQVTRFRCPFCHTSRSRKAPAKAHMERCWKNPALQGCKTCIFFVPGGYEPKSRVTTGAGGVRPALSPAKCKARFNLQKGLVTNCRKWSPVDEEAPTAA